jgi:Family of unknown function (DUF6516)
MKATLLIDQRDLLSEDVFAEIRLWRVPSPVPGSRHDFKYALAFVVGGDCVLRYDNEAGKGDHRHFGMAEQPYRFTTIARLLADFWNDVDRWRMR